MTTSRRALGNHAASICLLHIAGRCLEPPLAVAEAWSNPLTIASHLPVTAAARGAPR
jgi:hypothetical protein